MRDIAGILCGKAGAIVEESLLRRLTSVIEHRGPDGEGVLVGQGVGLARRGLAIIDPASGRQPMVDGQTDNVIVHNGEIYNYLEVRAELEGAGHVFETRSDAEAILKAYAQRGLGGLSALTECGPLPCGRRSTSSCSSPATGSASSRCATASTWVACYSSPRRRASSLPGAEDARHDAGRRLPLAQ